MILSEAEVSARLVKATSAPDALLDADLTAIIWPAAEALVKAETARHFEQATHTIYLDIHQNQRAILTPDYPVTTLTSLEAVTHVSSTGTRTLEAYTPEDYELDAASGRITLRSGVFPQGPGRVKLVCTTGYTAAQLAAGAIAEVMLVKSLLLKIIHREWAINRENKRHLRSHSYGDESATYNFDLTRDEERAVSLLRRHGR